VKLIGGVKVDSAFAAFCAAAIAGAAQNETNTTAIAILPG
jgi:hypothetical protein